MAPGRKRGANKGVAIGELSLGDLVLATVKGFPAWPAKISRPEDWKQEPDPKKHFVHFFGTNEIGFVSPPDIQVFTSETKEKLLQKCKGKIVKYFAEAVDEISAAFEELQNPKPDTLGNGEPSLTKPMILDGTDHREASNDGNSDKFDPKADPCLHKLVEKNGAETKPGVGEEDSSSYLKSSNRTKSSNEPLEHKLPDPILKVADSDDIIDGATGTENRDGVGKNSVNGQRKIKNIAGGLDERRKDEVHRAKCVPDSQAATDNRLLGPNQSVKGSKKGPGPGLEKESLGNKVVSDLNTASSKKPKDLLKEKPNALVCGDKLEDALDSKSGILGKKKRFEKELGKFASGADESRPAAKRPRFEDANNQKQCKSKSLLPVGEGKAERFDSTAIVSLQKREIVIGLSALGGKNQYKEVAASTKRHKQTVEHTSVSSFSGSRDKERINHLEQKIGSSATANVKVPRAQLPKRRRAVCILDEDDDEDPKAPVHGGHTNTPKATSATTDGPKSGNASHDASTKEKPLERNHGPRDKDVENNAEQKIGSSSAGNVKVPSSQLLKRRRAVCISDKDDDEDPKGPVHGEPTNIPKASSASTECPRSENAPHDVSSEVRLLERNHGSHDKEEKNNPEQKISSPSAADVKVPPSQLPKRRRAVCIYDKDDDEDPKTPVHGEHTNDSKATSASIVGPKSANEPRATSIKAKVLARSAETAETRKVHLYKRNKEASVPQPDSMKGYSLPVRQAATGLLPKNVTPILRSPKKSSQLVLYKKHVTGQNESSKVSDLEVLDHVKGPSNSSSLGKPVIKLPPKNVEQILISPKKSPELYTTKDQVAGQNKIAKVSGAGLPKKCRGDFSKDAVAGSDRVSSSLSQITKSTSGKKSVGTPKVATRLNNAGVSRDTSMSLSAGMIYVNQDNNSAPLISSGMPDSSASMRALIAAAQAKRKQAHSHTSPFANLDHSVRNIGETQMRSQSPYMAQNVSSPAGDALQIVSQGHQDDPTPSNHGHQSSSSNQAETDVNEERRVSPEHKSVGASLSGETEAAISRDAFEGMLETLSRTKESIGRATRQAIDCAKYGIASEVVELLIRKLESAPHFPRRVDLFFLVDSIIQCSHSQKGKAGALYIPTVQAALPRLLGAAAPPGTGARENRHKCRKVLKLWLDKKIFPDSLLRRYIGDIGASNGDGTVGFSLRRPSRSERSVDDPIRVMEGMLVDEYGSNASFQLLGLLSSHTFEDDEEDEDLPSTSQEVKNAHIDSLNDTAHCVLENVNGVAEMEDVSCQPREEVPSYVCGIEAKEDSPAATTASELPPSPEDSPPLPHESPPTPPPLPPSPPALAPLPPASPPQSIALLPSSITHPSMPGHPSLSLPPGFAPPAFPLLQHEYQISMQQSSISTSNQIAQVYGNAAHGRHADGDKFFKHEVPLQNQQLRPSNTSFLQSPMVRNLAPAPSHFPLQSQPQHPPFPHPYPFPLMPLEGRQQMNEDPWRMPSNGCRADTQNGVCISGRNPFSGSHTVAEVGFFQPPPERAPIRTMSYQLTANNLQARPTISGHTASQMLPSPPDIPSAARWRPS